MESNKQEKYDLLHDNPVAKDASGGRGGSWMSKHASQSRMSGGSPLHSEIGGDTPKKTFGERVEEDNIEQDKVDAELAKKGWQ